MCSVPQSDHGFKIQNAKKPHGYNVVGFDFF
ncbi:hypothetical protein SEEGA711_23819 [Salmonella enterica subsp. enterica serovar Gaminara str. ATCC BAA-711]|nr:hypothetical protein SEEGA711_23819 [Salmonella enterica subsp. enterica serovar Gaminara str. ATCC BAA-711]